MSPSSLGSDWIQTKSGLSCFQYSIVFLNLVLGQRSFPSREFKEYSYVSEATKVVKAMWINQGNEERLQKIFMKEIREVLKKYLI